MRNSKLSSNGSIKIPFQKSPTTFLEQVDKLLGKGLNVSNRDEVAKKLSVIGYYHLTPYWIPFYKDKNKHNFIEDTTIDDVLNIYYFDRNLRSIVFSAISFFEVYFKTIFANYLSVKYSDPFVLLRSNLFKNKDFYHNSLEMLKMSFDNSREEFANHFRKKYKEELPPIWVAVELMTLGEISKWYSNLKRPEDKIKISRNFDLTSSDMTVFLKSISYIRNICAHNCRLWNRAIKAPQKQVSENSQLYKLLNYESKVDDTKEDFRIYNPLTTLFFCINQYNNSGKEFVNQITQEIEKRKIDTKDMGFPDNWKEISIWKQ